jgi:hypothetical protein
MSKRNVELPTLHLTGYHSMPHLRSMIRKVLSSTVNISNLATLAKNCHHQQLWQTSCMPSQRMH